MLCLEGGGATRGAARWRWGGKGKEWVHTHHLEKEDVAHHPPIVVCGERGAAWGGRVVACTFVFKAVPL